ncbi:aminodeoxychorismate synthase component I [Streptomyces sp. NPDC101062]|uniref:aminodeoxychorismate synthase component I n=1 Tax=unclassified Streptomyces TaxID=2593676 RepID=UPI002E77E2B2|nr:aminodeoxychorismate synthase component I [Streptomyces sp. JV176]MEE1804335.1 aminodeoxychorismate synthase component I [Streptomyces sp. JV176]
MRVLLIDNYDSYTYNLYQLLAKVYGIPPVVVRNDAAAWGHLDLDGFDAAVISPGPGHPSIPRDFGRSRDVLEHARLPVLGVCLGHQGMGLLADARIVPAPQPRHGYLSTIRHSGDGIFAGVPQEFTAVRYHSLSVAEPVPAHLRITARAEDGVVMGLAHRDRPWWGVQFHPESICTEHGALLMANFRDLALDSGARERSTSIRDSEVSTDTGTDAVMDDMATSVVVPSAPHPQPHPHPHPTELQAQIGVLEGAVDAEAAFLALYGASARSFWLDSSHVEPGLARFSFFGAAEEPGTEMLTYRVEDEHVVVDPAGGIPHPEDGTIFDALNRRTGRVVTGAEELPFDFTGGYVGYFGYELKADLGGRRTHRSETPDAVWLQADRFIAVDHAEDRTYVVAVCEQQDVDTAQKWVNAVVPTLAELPTAPADTSPPPRAENHDASRRLVRSRTQYLADIRECDQRLREGVSYEICLTNKLRLPAPANDIAYYQRLRRLNPAPYAAFLRLSEVTVFSSSPERFLKVDAARTVETKPIKGTAPRHPDARTDDEIRRSLQKDPKTRAENLMIVDLLRNDLGRICEIGSVAVPSLMVTESYATVHQLVSTVTGTLRDDTSAVDAVRACFPGGSMTGAPKLRTMEIIDTLENEARGVYSGAIGFIGYTGTTDLSITIRTAVRHDGELTIGAGGAIVLDSDPVAEYEEMLLKAEATLRALPKARVSGA